MTEDVKISAFIARLAEGNARVEGLLEDCLGRVLRTALRHGATWTRLVTEDRARHVADWLKAADAANEEWLDRTDAQGRALKLMKFGRIEAIIAEADKAMTKALRGRTSAPIVEGDELAFEVLDNGWKIVRLLTPAALDRESDAMQHCVGNGAYDHLLTRDNLFLSLRAPSGEAHATLEVRNGRLCQIKGKQNRPPLRKYVDMLAPTIRRNWDASGIPPGTLRHVIDEDGRWHSLDALPEGLRMAGDFDLFGLSVDLPRNMTIGGSLTLFGGNVRRLPEGLTILGDMDLSDTHHRDLPDDLVVRVLDLAWTDITTLPRNLMVLDKLKLCGSKITTLPPCLVVGRFLDIRRTGIVDLPVDIPDECMIATDGGTRSARSIRRRQRLSGQWNRLFASRKAA